MNALDALMHMHDESERIIKIRNQVFNTELVYAELTSGKSGICMGPVLMFSNEWELGVECEVCRGDGEIRVECSCNGRSLHSLLENPCCGGWNQATCPECEGEGIRWKREI